MTRFRTGIILPLFIFFAACGASREVSSGGDRAIANIGSTVVAIYAPSASVLLAVAEDSGVVRSTDGGAHWEPWSAGLPTRYVSAFAINSRGDVFAATLGSGVYRQLAGAREWTRVDTTAAKNALARVPAITVSPIDNVIYAATLEHGVYRSSDNGATWHNYNVGLGILNINAIACSDDNVIYARCVGGGVFRHAALWDDWKPVNEGLEDPYVTTISSQHNGTVLLGTRNGKLYRLDDMQKGWSDITNDYPGYFVAVVSSTAGGVALAGTKSGVYRYRASTHHWSLVNPALESINVHSMTVLPDGTLYVGAANGDIVKAVVVAD